MVIPPLYLKTTSEKKMMVIIVLVKEENGQQQTMILDGLMEPSDGWDCCGLTMHAERNQGLQGFECELLTPICSLLAILPLFWPYFLGIEIEGTWKRQVLTTQAYIYHFQSHIISWASKYELHFFWYCLVLALANYPNHKKLTNIVQTKNSIEMQQKISFNFFLKKETIFFPLKTWNLQQNVCTSVFSGCQYAKACQKKHKLLSCLVENNLRLNISDG